MHSMASVLTETQTDKTQIIRALLKILTETSFYFNKLSFLHWFSPSIQLQVFLFFFTDVKTKTNES